MPFITNEMSNEIIKSARFLFRAQVTELCRVVERHPCWGGGSFQDEPQDVVGRDGRGEKAASSCLYGKHGGRLQSGSDDTDERTQPPNKCGE